MVIPFFFPYGDIQTGTDGNGTRGEMTDKIALLFLFFFFVPYNEKI